MTESVIIKCPLCSSMFKWGPHRYDGRETQRYDLKVCNMCWQQNWDGWSPEYESILLKHLEEKGLPIPERNAKGRLPRE